MAKKATAKKAKAKKAKATKTRKTKTKKTTRKATKKVTRKAAPKAKRAAPKARRAKAVPKSGLALERELAPARPPQIQATPSDRDGFFIVCELNSATGNFDLNCREVSSDELRELGALKAKLAVRRGLARAGRPQIQATPSDRDGFFIVCELNPATGNFDLNCREVSAAELRALR
jgi:hypothetical protein